MSAFRYALTMSGPVRRFACAVFGIFTLFACLFLLPRANAQNPLRRLTTTGDVLEFVWSPRGDAVYITRAGDTLSLSATRAQITGDLYRVAFEDAQSELLERDANFARPSPSGDEIAFVRLAQDGSARLMAVQTATEQTRDVDTVTWGAPPQWNRAGDALYYAQDGGITFRTRAESGAAFGGNVPPNAFVSPLGDRVAYTDANGLTLLQNNTTRSLTRNEQGVRVLTQMAWSNAGDKLAYLVARDAMQSELWIADTARGTSQKIGHGEMEYFANPAWSPDDTYVIFTRAPAGSSNANTSEIWRARTDGSDLRALTNNHAQEISPQYGRDGRSIAFVRDGDVWVMELNAQGLPAGKDTASQELALDYKTPRSPEAQRTPPTGIRVKHDGANACRSAPTGQIDTLDFETYVKRVVPAEVFPSWDDDALKTQAVAARSYAWFWILQHTASTFDVTDSTAYQYMCDTRYASTDNATDATRGQYLDYTGYMVFAAYGAENGDPTLTNNWGNPYLTGVDDPVGFGKTRAGNGLGYSQWGAQRWATQYDWNYQQILLHYYSNVTLEMPAGNLPDSAAPTGAIVLPWSHRSITSDSVRIVVNASDDASGIASIDLNAQYFDGASNRNMTIARLTGDAREYVWDVSALPNQTGIVLMPEIYDNNNNVFTAPGVAFDLDRKNPKGALAAPASTPTQNVLLTLNASDSGGSGLTGMMFSNDWVFEGEDQFVQNNSGSVAGDADAWNGHALRGLVGTNGAGVWYGPYTNVLPQQKSYRAYFRLKTDNVTTTAQVAQLDAVTDGGTNVLGLKSLSGTDFRSANEYQEFFVDFVYGGYSTNALELRVAYRANASLWLDRVLVVSYPVPYAASATWDLSGGQGSKHVTAKFADGAGNVSSDATADIFFGILPSPTPPLTPRAWLPFLFRGH